MLCTLYWHSLQSLPLSLLLITAVIAVTLWLYPPQVRLLGGVWRWSLPLLRAAALAAIVISLLKPVIIRPKTAIERGAVVVLLDDSRSMSVIDSARTAAHRVALAAALGRLPPGSAMQGNGSAASRDADHLQSLADKIARARSEVDYARLAGRGVDAAKSLLDQTIDDFQSVAQSAADKAATIHGQGGLQRTLASLRKPPADSSRDGWLDRLPDQVKSAPAEVERARLAADEQLFRTDPRVHDACIDLAKLSRMELASAAALDGDHGLVARLGPDVPVLGFGIGDRVTPFSASHSSG